MQHDKHFSFTAQTTCKNGLGRVLYERLPNQQLQGYDDDVVRDTAPPFRVLEKCQDLCLRDRTGTNNLVRTCTSFDFQPGSRITAFGGNTEYEESLCYLTSEQAGPEGIGSLMLVPNSVHFNEICLTSSRPERECPSRRYVFERHPRKKLKLPISDIKEITAANRSDCEDKCLNEFSFVCRSANFDSTMRSCSLSRFTRRTHPELLEDDPNSDYLENTCLNAERRCDGLAVFVKEENKRLGGPFEVDIFNNMTLEECQTMCLRAEKYFCRSVEFDDQTKQCILSEEDSVSQKDDISISSSPTHHFYDLVCLDNQRATDYPDNSVTSHLFSSGRRPDTAFQRYRNSRLGGEFHSEITGRSLSECLDECLRQTSFQCRSAVYSDRFRTCRLSRYNQKDGMRIIYDADYDYYENLMLNVINGAGDADDHSGSGSGSNNGHRPGERPGDSNWRNPNKDNDRYGNNRYNSAGSNVGVDYRFPYDRYPESDEYDRYHGQPDRYPSGERDYLDRDRHRDRERYPYAGPYEEDRYSMNGERHRYPNDRDRYPNDRDRYPADRDRYPADRDRYPSDMDHYAQTDRYPDNASNRRPYEDRIPLRNPYMERYPTTNFNDRYPTINRYPLRDRYSPYRPANGHFTPINDNKLPGDVTHGRPYPPDDDYPYRPYLIGNRYPDDRYAIRYPSRYPPPRDPLNVYTGRDAPDGVFPDRRFRPSSYDSRYPLVAEGSRDNAPPPRYGSDGRYPPEEILHNARRPEPDSTKRYPPAPLMPPPATHNRFPVGTDRFPMDIYKYGNRYGSPNSGGAGPGYRPRPPPPPAFYDMDYEERYNDRYSPYDRDYDRSLGRRPISSAIGLGYPPYEIPFNRPYHGGSGSLTPLPNEHPIPGSLPAPRPPTYSGPPSGSIPRPPITRCEESDNFKQIAARHKMRRHFIRRALVVPSLIQCERECVESREFICRSFNYRDTAVSNYDDRGLPNCELSDRDSRDLDVHDPSLFDAANYDFYERSIARSDGECMDVTQTCNEEGMEFTIRTPEGFVGRIYTYGYYDRCFFRGNGGTVNVLRISGPQGYPDCGTQKYGDTLTNIVVVQFSDNVQTSRDKRYNLTCVFRGPGEAIVTSGYIGAGSGSPIPIEYLPAENTLSSKVRLSILYQGRPTTTIAVGDPLTFRLEALDGYNHATDIFATNVLARDPYSGRSIQLIDRFGCPVDPYVFPELDKSRDGDTLEARFNAFKIPESNFLVFEATVRTCREGCQPAYCPGPSGRQEPSFGKRRRRSLNDSETVVEGISYEENENSTELFLEPIAERLTDELTELNSTTISATLGDENTIDNDNEEPEQVREMIEVFETREEIEKEAYPRRLMAPIETICLTPSEYHGLITAIILLLILLLSITLVAGLAYRRYWITMSKNRLADRHSPSHSFGNSSIRTHHERFGEIGQMPSGTNATNARNQRVTNSFRTNVSMFGGSLHKTFATGNLARMCQLPVMNPMRTNHSNTNHQFEDPSEPIYTDPSLFERSRSLRSLDGGNGEPEQRHAL
uniref:ZP domain-containing protein n=1 Tax=Glossina brevipalpis TaxID=37001 RepID=A0A1A9WP94_9MUSC